MNNLALFLILNIFISVYSCPIKPKFCIDCKFFTKQKYANDNHGVCTMFAKEDIAHYTDEDFLVTGIKTERPIEYYFCSTCRSSEKLCGQEGKSFEER